MGNPSQESTYNKGQEMAASMMEKGKEAISSGLEKGREAFSSSTVQEMTRKAGDLASNVSERAAEAVSTVGGQIKTLAGTIRENVPSQGLIGTAAGTVADTLEASGQYLEEQDLNDIGRDLVGVIRRYPIAAVFVGVGLGFLLARSTRS